MGAAGTLFKAAREGVARDTESLPLLGPLHERFALTRMESVVAGGLAEGLTYKEIATRCGVSYHTVHSHVKAIHEKAGVTTNGRLLAFIYGR